MGIAENCNSRHKNNSKTKSENKGEEHSFIEEKGEVGKAIIINKKAFEVNWEFKG